MLLQNNLVASHSLDDKACAATILHACRLLAQSGREPTDTDIFVHLSVGEEKTGVGARTLPYTVLDGFDFAKADGALVMDVNFGHAPGVADYESLALGKGGGVSYSATIKRAFTDFIVQLAAQKKLPLQTVVEMRSTGTNAGTLHRGGIPCAVLSLPLTNMHTFSECVSLDDMESCAVLVGRDHAPVSGGKSRGGAFQMKKQNDVPVYENIADNAFLRELCDMHGVSGDENVSHAALPRKSNRSATHCISIRSAT